MKIILFSFIGILFAFLVIVLILYITLRVILDRTGFRGQSLIGLYNESKKQAMLDKSRRKDVSGMTNVLLPTIKKYFPEFNEKEMYLWVETNLRNIFECIESRKEDLLSTDELSLIRDRLELEVRNLNHDDITKKYHDIVFHKHAIRDFKKDEGKAVITISSSLEYYYEERHGENVIYKDDYKKQTRYQTDFVYIYDVRKAGYDIKAIGLNCPNCGSPISGYNQRICKYCKSGINISTIDFKKCWKIVNFKEDY